MIREKEGKARNFMLFILLGGDTFSTFPQSRINNSTYIEFLALSVILEAQPSLAIIIS
jgi:hypothetical protein